MPLSISFRRKNKLALYSMIAILTLTVANKQQHYSYENKDQFDLDRLGTGNNLPSTLFKLK